MCLAFNISTIDTVRTSLCTYMHVQYVHFQIITDIRTYVQYIFYCAYTDQHVSCLVFVSLWLQACHG